ncbi:MAG: hypothetical protein LBJ25_05380 [Candidatus Margulisbacteria bacterium]|jgi:hypothetical protein|nr:hypothetical protein [Candidatus Margulisiibacteriota bacterium]
MTADLTQELELTLEMLSLSRLKPEDILDAASPAAKKLYLDDMRSRIEKYPVSSLVKVLCNPKTPPDIRAIAGKRFAELSADKDNLPMLKDSLYSFGREYMNELKEKNPEGYAQCAEQFNEVLEPGS